MDDFSGLPVTPRMVRELRGDRHVLAIFLLRSGKRSRHYCLPTGERGFSSRCPLLTLLIEAFLLDVLGEERLLFKGSDNFSPSSKSFLPVCWTKRRDLLFAETHFKVVR